MKQDCVNKMQISVVASKYKLRFITHYLSRRGQNLPRVIDYVLICFYISSNFLSALWTLGLYDMSHIKFYESFEQNDPETTLKNLFWC